MEPNAKVALAVLGIFVLIQLYMTKRYGGMWEVKHADGSFKYIGAKASFTSVVWHDVDMKTGTLAGPSKTTPGTPFLGRMSHTGPLNKVTTSYAYNLLNDTITLIVTEDGVEKKNLKMTRFTPTGPPPLAPELQPQVDPIQPMGAE